MAINAAAGFTTAELNSIGSALLEKYIQDGKSAFVQDVQNKPMLRIMEGGKKPYDASKEFISIGIKGVHGDGGTNDVVSGFARDDTVAFYNPNNMTRATYAWREHHLGITFDETELKGEGILVGDSFAKATRNQAARVSAKAVLMGLLLNKFEDYGEMWARGLNDLLWGDGTSDVKALAGMRSMVPDNPAAGTVGGIDCSVNANGFWRTRARTAAYQTAITGDGTLAGHGGDKVTSSASNGGALLQALQAEYRQLIRYGARPNRALAGSDFIGAMEVEFRANGSYSLSGFTDTQDGTVGSLRMPGGTILEYDPSLDDLSREKYCYWWSDKDICVRHLEGDWARAREPARPENQFVIHKSMTATGQLCAQRRNGAMVIEIN